MDGEAWIKRKFRLHSGASLAYLERTAYLPLSSDCGRPEGLPRSGVNSSYVATRAQQCLPGPAEAPAVPTHPGSGRSGEVGFQAGHIEMLVIPVICCSEKRLRFMQLAMLEISNASIAVKW